MPEWGINQETIRGRPSGSENTHRCCCDQRGEVASPFQVAPAEGDPVRLELSLTPAYGKDPVTVGLVESLDLVARRDREGRIPRDLQGTWDWTVRHGKVSTGGWNPYLKEALQTMFETGLPAIVFEELTGEEYHPVDGTRHVR